MDNIYKSINDEMLVATHGLITFNSQSKDCSSGPGREDIDGDVVLKKVKISWVESINIGGEMKDEEKLEWGCGPPMWSKCTVPQAMLATFVIQLINPIFSEWKSVGLEMMIPMMYHTWVTNKTPKSYW